MEYVNRVKFIIDTLGINQSKLAEKMGVSKGIISEFASGAREPSKDFLFGISKLGISIDWFLSGKGEMFISDNIPKIPLMENLRELVESTMDPRLNNVEARLEVLENLIKQVKPESSESDDPLYTAEPAPGYGVEKHEEIPYVHKIAAGPPIEMDIDLSETVAVPKRLLRKGGHYYAAAVQGGSMTERGIRDGDIVLIRRTDVPRDGAVQVVRYQNRVTLKMMHETEKGWELRYKDGTRQVILCDSDDYEVLGEFEAILPENTKINIK